MAGAAPSGTLAIHKKQRGNADAPVWSHFVAVVSVATLVIASSASAVVLTLDRTFNDPTVTFVDRFGWSVAIDGNNVLIGAASDGTNGLAVGQAYLFDANSGNLLQTFDDPTVTEVDHFGWSVAIDGNNVLIGAPDDDTNGFNVGQAYSVRRDQRQPAAHL